MSSFLEVGQVVRLVSGGPEMTINKIDEHKEIVHCVWFNCESIYPQQYSELQEGEFGFEAIQQI